MSIIPINMRKRFFIFIITLIFSEHLPAANPVLFNGAFAYNSEQKLLVMTLAGIVNRDSARLYMLNVYETWSYSKTDEQWRDIYRTRGGIQYDSIYSVTALVDRFRPFIQGAITYDPNRRW